MDHLTIFELSYVSKIIWAAHVRQFVQDPFDRFVIHSTILHFSLPALQPYLEQVFVETVAHCACERQVREFDVKLHRERQYTNLAICR